MKKYEEIDFLVLNDYITIEEGNKRTDELLKEEYRCGFYQILEVIIIISVQRF